MIKFDNNNIIIGDTSGMVNSGSDSNLRHVIGVFQCCGSRRTSNPWPVL